MKSRCGTPNNTTEVAKTSLLGSQKPRRQLASWFSLPDVGHIMAYGCLQYPRQNTPGCQEISYSYLTSKLELCLNCFQNNLLPGCVLEVCSKQNKTRHVPHLCVSLKLLLLTQRLCCTQKPTAPHQFFTLFKKTFLWREWWLGAVERGKVTAPCWDCKGEWCPWVYVVLSPMGLGLILEIGLVLQNTYIAIIILWS